MLKMHILKPDCQMQSKQIEKTPELEELQELVGGYIEVVKVIFNGKKCDMYVNDEGLLINLPHNTTASDIYAKNRMPDASILIGIKGTAVIIEKFRNKKGQTNESN